LRKVTGKNLFPQKHAHKVAPRSMQKPTLPKSSLLKSSDNLFRMIDINPDTDEEQGEQEEEVAQDA